MAQYLQPSYESRALIPRVIQRRLNGYVLRWKFRISGELRLRPIIYLIAAKPLFFSVCGFCLLWEIS
jgi:hypothetical protein